MAISIISEPRSPFNPAYNPLIYVFDSNLKNNAQFRYTVTIRTTAPVPFTIADLRVAPRNGDGYGYVDISNILKNYVDKALVWNSDYDATKDVVFEYEVCFGEEYLLTTGYDYIFDSNGYMALGRNTPHALTSLDIGTQIVCTNSFPGYIDARQRVNGFHTIRNIPTGFTIETTTPWAVFGFPSAQPVGGTWKYAGQRNYIKRNQICIYGAVLNAAYSLDQFKDHVDTADPDFVLNGITKSILTNMPEKTFYVTPTQEAYLHAFNYFPTYSNFIYFQNSNGDIFRRAFPGYLTASVIGYQCGPGNIPTLGVVSGTLPLIKPNTEWYDVWIADTGLSRISKTYRFNLDKRCAINDIQILFMDRKSSWLSYAFQLRTQETIQTEKRTYRKEIPKVSTPNWVTISRDDRGTQTYHSRFKSVYELNTNWMNDDMSVYFNELLTSPYTYINFGDGKWYGCQVEDMTDKVPRQKNENLIRRTIKVFPSIESPVQDASTITPFIGKGYNVSDGFVDPAPDEWNPRDLDVGVNPG